MSISRLEALARLCESASGPAWVLDKEIAVEIREEIGDCADDEVPAFSMSVDAALMLVRPGKGWNVQGNMDVFYGVVAGSYSKSAKTAALALSAAALRDRAVAP